MRALEEFIGLFGFFGHEHNRVVNVDLSIAL